MDDRTVPFRDTIDTPIGPLVLAADHTALVRIAFAGLDGPATPNMITRRAIEELDRYFAGTLTGFSVPVAPAPTAFARAVLKAVAAVPFGRLASYGDIARAIARPGAARAVGLANRDNRLPIIVPCHRIVGADGRLTGYAGGLSTKAWLIEHERRVREARDAA